MNHAPNQTANYMQSLRAYLRTTPWPLLSFAAAFGLIDLLIVPITMSFHGPFNPLLFFLFTLFGCITSQFAAISMWWAWSRSEVMWRTLIVVPLVFTLVCLFVSGIVVNKTMNDFWLSPQSDMTTLLFLAVHVAYGLAAASTPLWIMRKLFGWGILPMVSEENHGFTRQISIRDIMVATVIVAVLAALAKQMIELPFNPLPEVMIFTGFAGIISTVTLLPMTYLMLHEKMLQNGFVRAMIISGLSPLLFLIIIGTSTGAISMPAEAVLMLFVVCYAYLGSVMLMLYACRRAGFRLLTAWDKLPADEIVILSTQENKINEREITFVDE